MAYNKDPLPDPKEKHPLPHVFYDSYVSTWMCFWRTHENIAKKKNQQKKRSGVFFSGAASRGKKSSPALLWAQGWRSEVIIWPDVDWTPSYPDLTSIHSSSVARSFSKQAVFTQTATSASQADRRTHVVNKGRMLSQEACKDPLSVMSLDQLHC